MCSEGGFFFFLRFQGGEARGFAGSGFLLFLFGEGEFGEGFAAGGIGGGGFLGAQLSSEAGIGFKIAGVLGGFGLGGVGGGKFGFGGKAGGLGGSLRGAAASEFGGGGLGVFAGSFRGKAGGFGLGSGLFGLPALGVFFVGGGKARGVFLIETLLVDAIADKAEEE